MSVATLTYTTIDPNQASWDATINDNMELTREWLQDGPLPIKEYANPGSLPAAGSWDRSIAFANDGGTWKLYFSNGSGWVEASPGASKLDLAGGTLTGLLTLTHATNPAIKFVAPVTEGIQVGTILFERSGSSNYQRLVYDTLSDMVRIEGYNGASRLSNYQFFRDDVGLVIADTNLNASALSPLQVSTIGVEPRLLMETPELHRLNGGTIHFHHQRRRITSVVGTSNDPITDHEASTMNRLVAGQNFDDGFIYGVKTGAIVKHAKDDRAAAETTVLSDGTPTVACGAGSGTTIFYFESTGGNVRATNTSGVAPTTLFSIGAAKNIEALVYDGALLWYANRSDGLLRKSTLAGSKTTVVTLGGGDTGPWAFALDPANDVGWFVKEDSGGNSDLVRVVLSTGAQTTIFRSDIETEWPEDRCVSLAFNPVTGRVIAAFGAEGVRVLEFDGGATTAVAEVVASLNYVIHYVASIQSVDIAYDDTTDKLYAIVDESIGADRFLLTYEPEHTPEGVYFYDIEGQPNVSTRAAVVDVANGRIGVGRSGDFRPAGDFHAKSTNPSLILQPVDSSGTPQILLRDSAGANRSRQYWDQANDRVVWQTYADSGVGVIAAYVTHDGRFGFGSMPTDPDSLLINRSGQPAQLRFQNSGSPSGTENSHFGKTLYSNSTARALGLRCDTLGATTGKLSIVRRESSVESVIGSINYTAANPGYIDMANGFFVAGVKVLGAQGAAVADATGAGDIVARFNELKARCEAHGLIAS